MNSIWKFVSSSWPDIMEMFFQLICPLFAVLSEMITAGGKM